MATTSTAATFRVAIDGFLRVLPAEQRAAVQIPFDHVGRTRWDSGPRERALGLRWDALAPAAQPLVEDVLATVHSLHGLRCIWGIRSLEAILGRLEGGRPHRQPGRYWVQVFGDPQQRTVGFRFEGHHCSVNVTVVGDQVRATPLFRATNPARVPDEEVRPGWRVLAAEEDAGRAWYGALDDTARAQATLPGEALLDTRTACAEAISANALDDEGLDATSLPALVRARLVAALRAWTGHLTDDLAADLIDRAGLADAAGLRAAWRGSAAVGAPHSWSLAGGGLILEFAMGQNAGNHIHAVVRDADGDFGRDLL